MAKRENYNDLYLFMLVVREGSFTAAAQRLGLAQSGVSRAVRELEERLGVQLLVRTTRKLSLTQAVLSQHPHRYRPHQCQPARH